METREQMAFESSWSLIKCHSVMALWFPIMRNPRNCKDLW